jgi:tRNA nucleotidyltransferase (CCA-adding enzyme)
MKKQQAYIDTPEEVDFILDTLEDKGYEAFIVGGCVRDVVLGKPPKDWDICTSAFPHEILGCFHEYQTIETRLQHGTITLVLKGLPFEITTYRVDGTYQDKRRPDEVTFVRDITEDLLRRDFTINAMAYSPKRGFIDVFNSFQEIENHVIRCVGDAATRFEEDVLRMMRALRFASVLVLCKVQNYR